MEDLFDKISFEDSLFKILEAQPSDEILASEVTKAQLEDIYFAVYEARPLSGSTKKDILSMLRNRMATVRRAQAFIQLSEK